MKLKTLFALFALFIAMHASAQELSVGIVAGAATGAVKITDIKNNSADLVKGKGIYGFEAGLYVRLKFGPFYMKPQVLFNHQQGTVDVFTPEQETQFSHFHQGKVEIPFLFGLKFLGPVGIEAGPVYNYIMYGTKHFAGNNINIQKGGLGYRVGTGVDIGRISLTFSYQGLMNKSSGNSLSTYQTPYEFIGDIGIRLGKAKP